MKYFFLLIYCCIFFGLSNLFAQSEFKKPVSYSRVARVSPPSDSLLVPVSKSDNNRSNPFRIKLASSPLKMGVMCIGEQKFEKATKVPLRLRLGSLAHTDWLECKPNSFR
jgi:hypothetical protein